MSRDQLATARMMVAGALMVAQNMAVDAAEHIGPEDKEGLSIDRDGALSEDVVNAKDCREVVMEIHKLEHNRLGVIVTNKVSGEEVAMMISVGSMDNFTRKHLGSSHLWWKSGEVPS